MKKQINFNALAKQILDQYNDNNYNPLGDFNELTKNVFKHMDFDENIDEYYLARIIKSVLGIAGKQNIDLNKYFPCFIEI